MAVMPGSFFPSMYSSMAPVPFRGKTNTPALVPHVAARLAELRGVSVQRIAQVTSDNFTRLFARVAA